MRRVEAGYVLPATIMLALGIFIVSVYFLQYIVSVSTSLNSQNYTALAREAADAGVAYANNCVSGGSYGWTTLQPGVDCNGAGTVKNVTSSPNGSWVSTFSVSTPQPSGNQYRAIATGTVNIMQGSNVVGHYTVQKVALLNTAYAPLPQSQGQSITEVKADQTACAIANGKLYCWGDNYWGQLGQNQPNYILPASATPLLVGGALAGKYVTKVSVSDHDVCAIADGQGYCWGDNSNYQIGDGTYSNSTTPVPVGGALAGKKITDISTAQHLYPNWGGVPVYSSGYHSCALSDGIPYCWGSPEYGQTGTTTTFPWFGITITLPNIYTFVTTPTRVYGYNSGENASILAGKKADRIASGAHASCQVSQSQQYCWGFQAPIGFFPQAQLPYNAGGAYPGKFIDASTWEGSGDYVCSMANTDFTCFGYSPGTNPGYTDAYKPPTVYRSSTDVTTNDNGDNPYNSYVNAWFCWIEKGTLKCMGNGGTTPININVGNRVPTKVGVGQNGGTFGNYYACTAANGQLMCTGVAYSGELADGNLAQHSYPNPIPSPIGSSLNAFVTGLDGSNNPIIGTKDGTYAASGPLSVGSQHACGVVNGALYCWGSNSNGQLGLGTTPATSPNQPTIVPTFSAPTQTVTKVSAGSNHTCAISNGQLYCWGSNSNGQLGIGAASVGSNQSTPQQVTFFNSMRVTDISANGNSTCAVANGMAYCWGDNSSQQLGISTLTNTNPTPLELNGDGGDLTTSNGVSTVSLAADHACATSWGNIYCWGANNNGQLGTNDTLNRATPVLLTQGTVATTDTASGLTDYVSSVSAGNGFTCAVINSLLSCWGKNDQGQLGMGNPSEYHIPTLVPGLSTVQINNISAGDTHACAIAQGKTYCWGNGANYRLGLGSDVSVHTTPQLLTTTDMDGNNSPSTAIAAGLSSTCSITNGDILCWGDNSSGKLGNFAATGTTPFHTDKYLISAPFSKGPTF